MFHFPSFFKHVLAASHSLFAVSMEPSCERLLVSSFSVLL